MLYKYNLEVTVFTYILTHKTVYQSESFFQADFQNCDRKRASFS